MMNCLYYWLIEPLVEDFLDTDKSVPITSWWIEGVGKRLDLALFANDQRRLTYARLTIPQLDTEEIPESLLPMIEVLRQHLVSVLRLKYHRSCSLFPSATWVFVEESKPYSYGLSFSDGRRIISYDIDEIKRLFIGSLAQRDEVRLLVNGMDSGIPLQYRFLSLYKVLELEFRKNGKLDTKAMKCFLEPYANDFLALSIPRSPLNYLIGLRDSCAHISKKNGDTIEMGVTELRRDQTFKVESILPLLLKICADVLNERSQGSYTIRVNELPLSSTLGA